MFPVNKHLNGKKAEIYLCQRENEKQKEMRLLVGICSRRYTFSMNVRMAKI